MKTLLEEIVETFSSPVRTIPKANVIDWMKADDIEALGALYSFLMEQKQFARINPAPTLGETAAFVTRYLERCFREDPDGDWSDSRYGAARHWPRGSPDCGRTMESTGKNW